MDSRLELDIGANYLISANFAVYGLISDSFRLPSLEDLNEWRPRCGWVGLWVRRWRIGWRATDAATATSNKPTTRAGGARHEHDNL